MEAHLKKLRKTVAKILQSGLGSDGEWLHWTHDVRIITHKLPEGAQKSLVVRYRNGHPRWPQHDKAAAAALRAAGIDFTVIDGLGRLADDCGLLITPDQEVPAAQGPYGVADVLPESDQIKWRASR